MILFGRLAVALVAPSDFLLSPASVAHPPSHPPVYPLSLCVPPWSHAVTVGVFIISSRVPHFAAPRSCCCLLFLFFRMVCMYVCTCICQRASLDIDLSVRRASVDSLLQIGHRLLAGETRNERRNVNICSDQYLRMANQSYLPVYSKSWYFDVFGGVRLILPKITGQKKTRSRFC